MLGKAAAFQKLYTQKSDNVRQVWVKQPPFRSHIPKNRTADAPINLRHPLLKRIMVKIHKSHLTIYKYVVKIVLGNVTGNVTDNVSEKNNRTNRCRRGCRGFRNFSGGERFMKRFLAVLMAVVMVMSLAACSKSESESTGSVYWLNFKPESDEVLQQVAALYTEETGVEVKVVTAASGEYNSTLTSEMDKSGAPTLFVVGNEASVSTWSDYCYDLTGTKIANELNTDAYSLYDASGKLCSIGYCYECYGIIVNKALLKQAGHDISEITNFATLKAVADDIHANADTLGFDAFTSSGMDSSSSWRFSGHLANMPLYYEGIDSTTATLTGAYLGNFRNIWDLYITDSAYDPATLATGGYDAENEFVSGKAVFYQNGSWEYSACSVLGDDNIAMIPIYCGVSGEENIGLCAGTENCWAVNAKASEADINATLDFMYWMATDAEASELLVGTFGVMPYKQAAASTNKFLADANDYANAGKTTVTWAFNYTPNVDDWRAAVVAAMNIYDADMTDENWAQVESVFVNEWANQYKLANQ